jgi:hypothetical protein
LAGTSKFCLVQWGPWAASLHGITISLFSLCVTQMQHHPLVTKYVDLCVTIMGQVVHFKYTKCICFGNSGMQVICILCVKLLFSHAVYYIIFKHTCTKHWNWTAGFLVLPCTSQGFHDYLQNTLCSLHIMFLDNSIMQQTEV